MTDNVIQLVNQLDSNEFDKVDTILRKLIDIGSENLNELIDSFTSSEKPFVRMNLAFVFGEIRNSNTVQPLISALDDNNALVRERAVSALGKIGDDSATDELISALRTDNSYNVREIAAWALSKIGDKSAIPALIDALADEEIEVISNVIDALAHLATEDTQELINALNYDNEAVQCGVIEVFSKIGLSHIRGILTELLSYPSDRVRNCAVQALRGLQSPEMIPHFLTLLDDDYYLVRANVALALGEIGDSSVLESLKKLINDSNQKVSSSALQAVKLIENP